MFLSLPLTLLLSFLLLFAIHPGIVAVTITRLVRWLPFETRKLPSHEAD